MSSISSADRTEGDFVEPELVPLQGCQRLVCPAQDGGGILNTCRCPRTYEAIVRMDLLTDSTGNRLAERLGLLCDAGPVSSVGSDPSGKQLNPGAEDLVGVRTQDDCAVHFG